MKSCVSELCVKQICVKQGVGVSKNAVFVASEFYVHSNLRYTQSEL